MLHSIYPDDVAGKIRAPDRSSPSRIKAPYSRRLIAKDPDMVTTGTRRHPLYSENMPSCRESPIHYRRPKRQSNIRRLETNFYKRGTT